MSKPSSGIHLAQYCCDELALYVPKVKKPIPVSARFMLRMPLMKLWHTLAIGSSYACFQIINYHTLVFLKRLPMLPVHYYVV